MIHREPTCTGSNVECPGHKTEASSCLERAKITFNSLNNTGFLRCNLPFMFGKHFPFPLECLSQGYSASRARPCCRSLKPKALNSPILKSGNCDNNNHEKKEHCKKSQSHNNMFSITATFPSGSVSVSKLENKGNNHTTTIAIRALDRHPKPEALNLQPQTLNLRPKALLWEFPKLRGTFFGGPYNKDPTI